ncbi:MAG TPA: NAD(P) transhydrogenase subunit alpha [Opitutaceae bacterium]
MECLVLKERKTGETRAALSPVSAEKLVSLGLVVNAEHGIGEASNHRDADYEKAGVRFVADPGTALGSADLHLRVNKPSAGDVARMKRGSVLLAMLDPFNDRELVAAAARAGLSAVSLEMIPRSTIAQKMDVLSSQANLAGYVAVLAAAGALKTVLPMMMTPAGTLSPARAFIIGVGVAGLQAIATAKRLGARVEAFDTRPVVEEQVKSLGAKFIKIDLGGETGQTAQGYARELTPEQIQRQREGMAKVCAYSDIVIATAKLFGKKAPLLVTHEMVAGMKNGSVIVDLAAEAGGNVDGTKAGEDIVTENGVTIIGRTCLEGRVANHATQLYAANVTAFVEHFWNADGKTMRVDPDNELMKGCLLTHGGAIVHEGFKTKS